MKNERKSKVISILGIAFSLLFSGCAEPENQPGTVIVDWEIVIGCSVAEVDTVEARLIDMESHLTNLSYDSAATNCSAEEPLIFASVPPGRYDILVEGFNAKGEGTYMSAPESFTLSPGATYEMPSIPLTQKRGAIDVKWVFGNGELCAANKVTSIQLSILDETSSQLFEEELLEPYPCDPYEMSDGERTIGANPQPLEELNGILLGDLIAGEHYVYAYGLNENGEKVAKGMLKANVDLGFVFEGKVTLVPCEATDYPTMDCE